MVDGEHRIAYNSVLFPFDTLHGALFPACLALLRVVFSVFCVFCGGFGKLFDIIGFALGARE